MGVETMSAKRVAVNGIDLAYEEVGRGSRLFVLVHGFTGSRDDFREQLPHLAELGWTIALDQRGHGDSTNTGHSESYTLEQLVEDLRAFLEAHEIDQCDLLGHSMGGMVALRFVLAYPGRVASLVLMDTAASALQDLPRAVLEAGGAVARTSGMQPLCELMRLRAADDPQRAAADRRLEAEMGPERYWERRRAKLLAMDPEAFASLGLALVDQEPVTDRLSEIRCPTLVLVGEQDRPFLGPAEEFERRIPRATRVIIPEAAHSPQLENAPAWLAAIREHLVRVRQSP